MSANKDRRRHTRVSPPRKRDDEGGLSVDVPELMKMPPIELEDISLGGFKVVVLRRPEDGEYVTCSLNIEDVTMKNIRARVVRVLENFGEPPTWTVGLELEMDEDKRRRFEALFMSITSGSA